MSRRTKSKLAVESSKIENMICREWSNVKKYVIWQPQAGVYEIFDSYKIINNEDGYLVYLRDNLIGNFSQTKTALAWCIFHKYGNTNLASSILKLDNRLTLLDSDIKCRTQAASKSIDLDKRDMILTKIEPKILRRKQIVSEINKCINTARGCQIQGFNNETYRSDFKSTTR